MQRVRKHKTILNKILRDERLSPHRRLLAEMLAIWLDIEPEYKREFFELIKANYGKASRIMWLEGDKNDLTPKIGKIEEEATQALKNYFAQIQDVAENENEVSTEILSVSGE